MRPAARCPKHHIQPITPKAPMTTAQTEPNLFRIVMELAREPGHPEGDRADRYVLIAPLDDDGQLDGKAWKSVRERCRVLRENPGKAAQIGHLVHGPGGRWTIEYPDRPDEAGFRFETEHFIPGEYVSVVRDDAPHVFQVVV